MSSIIQLALSEEVSNANRLLSRYRSTVMNLRDECDAIWAKLEDEYIGKPVEFICTDNPREPMFVVGRSFASDEYSTRFVSLGRYAKVVERIGGKPKSVRRLVACGSWPLALVMRWGDPTRRPSPAAFDSTRLSNNAIHYALAIGRDIGVAATGGPVFSMGGTIRVNGTDRPMYPSDIGIVADDSLIDDFVDAIRSARIATSALQAEIDKARNTEKNESSERERTRDEKKAARRRVEETQTTRSEKTDAEEPEAETTTKATAPNDKGGVRRLPPKRPGSGNRRGGSKRRR